MAPDGPSRSRLRSLVRLVLWGMAVGQVADALWMRGRRQQITALPVPPDTAAPESERDGTDVEVMAVAGSEVDPATRAAAAQEIAAGAAQVIDLVPADLPIERALMMLHRVEPERLKAPSHSPGGAHEAVAMHPSVAERMGFDGTPVEDRGEMVRQTVRAQRHAATSSVVRVAPTLRATRLDPVGRWRELEELGAPARPMGQMAPVITAVESTYLLALTAGLFAAPVAGAAALASWCAQPLLVFGGESPGGTVAMRPPGLLRGSLLRLPRAWADNLALIRAGYRATQARLAAMPPRPPAPPAEELFEPRRDTCPWCGSGALVDRFDTTDVLQYKPGEFHLDECADCGHVFQNPALSLQGLDYYYADFYDGIGADGAEALFAGTEPSYAGRIEAVARNIEPRSWLDVGTGHGHFPLHARQRWPEATFDGLDFGEGVVEAKSRGWIDTAYQGLFPDLADGLPRSYDVVSMHHYLEHTRDPRRELLAAAKVLEPGGCLMIEVPDPESPWARRLGRWWHCWFQPQHQHFVTCANLTAALEETGFAVRSVERGPATMGIDLAGATTLAIGNLVPSPHMPWRQTPSLAYRLKRLAVFAALGPLIPLTGVVDMVKDAFIGPDDIGNAYRVVAQRI